MSSPDGSDCLFCGIVAGTVPSDAVWDDDLTYAFHDINPAAPTHVLIVPRQHVDHFGSIGPEHGDLLGALVASAQKVAEQEGVADDGYRIVANVGRHGGMTVHHLHLHLLGGRPLRWPPE